MLWTDVEFVEGQTHNELHNQIHITEKEQEKEALLKWKEKREVMFDEKMLSATESVRRTKLRLLSMSKAVAKKH